MATGLPPAGASPGSGWPAVAAGLALVPALAFAIAAARGLHPLAPTVPELLGAGASWGPRTLDDEPWRVATASLCHAGVRHLLGNVVVIALAGAAVERLVGRAALVIAFVAAALVGTAASTLANPVTVIAGASSGALGLAALLAIATARHGHALHRWQRRATVGGLVALIGYHVVLAVTRDDVDIVGHAAGALTGLVAGLLGRGPRALGGLAASAVVVAGGLVALARPAPDDPYRLPRQVVAIERRFDQLVGPPSRPTPRTDALARALIDEVAVPLEALAALDRRDAELPARLGAAMERIRRYAGARAAVVRLYVTYLRHQDPTVLRRIEADSTAAEQLLERPIADD